MVGALCCSTVRWSPAVAGQPMSSTQGHVSRGGNALGRCGGLLRLAWQTLAGRGRVGESRSGSDERTYPCGDRWDASKADTCQSDLACPQPVGSYRCDGSP